MSVAVLGAEYMGPTVIWLGPSHHGLVLVFYLSLAHAPVDALLSDSDCFASDCKSVYLNRLSSLFVKSICSATCNSVSRVP